jgi:hypothetical protein
VPQGPDPRSPLGPRPAPRPGQLPTVGQIMEQITAGAFDGAADDAGYPERVRQTIY